jgi:UMF1 family MFS transporter
VQLIRNLKNYPEVLLFLMAFWLYSDGIGTIIQMATIYGTEVGITSDHLIGAILLVQFLGFPATFVFCFLAKKFTAKSALMACLAGYLGISVLGYFMSEAWHFWVLALGISIVQGPSQALSRSIFGQMIPAERSSEFFGFFSFSSKFAGIFGPLFFSLASQLTGTGRYGILVVILMFLTGMFLLAKVRVVPAARNNTTSYSL